MNFIVSQAAGSGIMEQMRYTVVLEKEPAGGFVATVPALAGCVSQGETREETIANIREAIELYVEDCIASGDPVPQEAGREFVEVNAPA